MDDQKRDREILVFDSDQDYYPAYGWVIATAIVAAIIIVFFLLGGFDLFSENETQQRTETINLDEAPTE